ncbi:MAG: RNA-splicing ligase RtcB [Candidatus Methylomirabilota bacterium]|nr:MAG: RNA-splicing ligase RtcB [candidate division NC10 bacterium]
MGTVVQKLDDYRWLLPQDYKPGMRVPGIIYADEALMEAIMKDLSLEQVANGAFLPGIVKASFAMPDIHQGYGLPVGGVVATNIRDGVLSPGAVGYDINCGVRLLRTELTQADVQPRLKELVVALFREIPTGVGSRGRIRLSQKAAEEPLLKGAAWAVKQGYGESADLAHIESGGCLSDADPEAVSHKAFERGSSQLGTLGSGNHFLEVQSVAEIYDPHAAGVLGLFEGQVTILIHTGSRGLGHQVCTDYLVEMERAIVKYGIELPDRQLACTPWNSPEAKAYLGAMRAAANFAWTNRQCLAHWTKEVLLRVLNISPRTLGLATVYDVAHNIVKVEEHEVEGKRMKLAVHRKGATRAFPPGHPELPAHYQAIGQPVLIPGDMGRASFVLVGTGAMQQTFGSTCHGAGRVMSRHAAIRAAKGRAIHRELEDQGIIVKASGRESLAEEMPEAYKDAMQVVTVVHRAGLSRMVARLRPMGVIKG